jgi:hypothetical protein
MRLALLVLLLASPALAKKKGGTIYVQGGYTKKNGQYVAPHLKSVPDGKKWNNLKGEQ